VVAFVASVVVSGTLFGIGFWYMNKRPVDRVTTWGEAMVGATYVFGTLFWIYGVVPHQWIQWADSDLGWRNDRFLVGPGEILADLPFEIPYTALRDTIVVLIHVVFVAAQLVAWSAWQNRGKRAAEPEPVRSDYGRPLVRGEVTA
jgi:hypothetical protein